MTNLETAERIIEQARAVGLKLDPLGEKLLRADRNEGPYILYCAWRYDKLDVEDLRRHILHVWEMAELPSRLGHGIWLEMFSACGFVEDEPGMLAALPNPLTVYRGCARSRQRGFSWTLNRKQAQWFAQRSELFGFPSAVFEITLPHDRILGLNVGVEGRGEAEVIVNPRRLRGRWSPR